MILGLVAGILTMCGIIPQIYKAHKTKQVKDVSRGMLIILLLGVLLWTIYGIMKNDVPIYVTNAIAFLLNGYMLLLTFKLNQNDT
ncbi:SemiSWEET family sugar transporter [Rasiella sp. SM2506]|uniref:SemiSWEET family sugar transporter n=1 Tax=Rasiella sp. SM2506 TaxID=3423914 RepID=UPI003D7A123D